MTREEFDALVHRIDERLGSRPLALRVRVGLMVLLGYAGFLAWFMLLFLVGLAFSVGAVAVDTGPGLALLVAGSLLLTLGGLQAVELLWVPIKPSPGRALVAEEVPRLWETLSRLRVALRSRRCEVLLSAEFNAGVQQIPRLGVFGWPRNYLFLGLPLLEALSEREFEAVLAHELAHLSAYDGRFSAWIYRLRRTWEPVFARLHQPATSRFGRALRTSLIRFLDWYWPRFNAYAFVLSRTNEYSADRFACQWAGANSATSALWRIACQGRRIDEKFWPDLWRLANSQTQPPSDVTKRLADTIGQSPDAPDAWRWMDRAARTVTDNLDSHPSLSDRLRAMGVSLANCRTSGFPSPARPSAAEAWLGGRLDEIRKDVDAVWQREVDENWRRSYGRASCLQHNLASLEQVPRDPELDPDLLWDKAKAILGLEGPQAAAPLLRRLLTLRPTHSGANLVLGQSLLELGEPEGEGLLQRILDADDDELIPQACDILARHFQSVGLTQRVQEVHHRLSRFEAAAAAAQRERGEVSVSDRFLPHELTSEEMAALHDVLDSDPDLGSAFLVRKELKYFTRQRLFVLCVRSATSRWAFHGGRDEATANRLVPRIRLPGRVLVIASQPGFRALARKVVRSPGAQIYPLPTGIADS